MTGVWIDREKVRIFREVEGVFRQVEKIEADPRQLGFLQVGEGNVLFQRAAQSLKTAGQIILVGPGLAKHHFRTYLMEQHPSIARKVLGLEEVDASLEKEARKILWQNFKGGS